jgi:hypothetical protein
MKTREAPECSCFCVTLMHLKRKKLEMERYVSDALHFLFSKLFANSYMRRTKKPKHILGVLRSTSGFNLYLFLFISSSQRWRKIY